MLKEVYLNGIVKIIIALMILLTVYNIAELYQPMTPEKAAAICVDNIPRPFPFLDQDSYVKAVQACTNIKR